MYPLGVYAGMSVSASLRYCDYELGFSQKSNLRPHFVVREGINYDKRQMIIMADATSLDTLPHTLLVMVLYLVESANIIYFHSHRFNSPGNAFNYIEVIEFTRLCRTGIQPFDFARPMNRCLSISQFLQKSWTKEDDAVIHSIQREYGSLPGITTKEIIQRTVARFAQDSQNSQDSQLEDREVRTYRVVEVRRRKLGIYSNKVQQVRDSSLLFHAQSIVEMVYGSQNQDQQALSRLAQKTLRETMDVVHPEIPFTDKKLQETIHDTERMLHFREEAKAYTKKSPYSLSQIDLIIDFYEMSQLATLPNTSVPNSVLNSVPNPPVIREQLITHLARSGHRRTKEQLRNSCIPSANKVEKQQRQSDNLQVDCYKSHLLNALREWRRFAANNID